MRSILIAIAGLVLLASVVGCGAEAGSDVAAESETTITTSPDGADESGTTTSRSAPDAADGSYARVANSPAGQSAQHEIEAFTYCTLDLNARPSFPDECPYGVFQLVPELGELELPPGYVVHLLRELAEKAERLGCEECARNLRSEADLIE